MGNAFVCRGVNDTAVENEVYSNEYYCNSSDEYDDENDLVQSFECFQCDDSQNIIPKNETGVEEKESEPSPEEEEIKRNLWKVVRNAFTTKKPHNRMSCVVSELIKKHKAQTFKSIINDHYKRDEKNFESWMESFVKTTCIDHPSAYLCNCGACPAYEEIKDTVSNTQSVSNADDIIMLCQAYSTFNEDSSTTSKSNLPHLINVAQASYDSSNGDMKRAFYCIIYAMIQFKSSSLAKKKTEDSLIGKKKSEPLIGKKVPKTQEGSRRVQPARKCKK